jgi:hypothetical protein
VDDELGQRRGVESGRGGREPVGEGGAVESDQGVEVDDAATLVLGDLCVLHSGHLRQPGGGDTEGVGDQPAQGDGEPAPQIRGPPLPHHVGDVVVALRAQRLPEQRVVLAVPEWTGPGPAVGAARTGIGGGMGVAAAARVPAAVVAACVNRTEGRAGEGGEHQRMVGHASGTPLPPATPARMRWNMSAAYSREHDGHRAARRLPQRTWVTPSRSWPLE